MCVAAVIGTDKFLTTPRFSPGQLNQLQSFLDERITSKRALIKNNALALEQAENEIIKNEAVIERIKRIAAENEEELQGLLDEKERISVQLAGGEL